MKVKINKKFKELLNRPECLSAFMKVALGEVPEFYFPWLVENKYIKNGADGYELYDNSVIAKRTNESREHRSRCIWNIEEIEVPKSELDYFRIAKAFGEMFKQNLINIRARTFNVERAVYSAWVDPIRLMIDTEGVTEEDLREVFRFLRNHKFWSSNVQSTKKLREKFQTIHTQSKRDEQEKRDGKGRNGGISNDYLERIANDLSS